MTKRNCNSTHLGVPCRRAKGHDGKHSGLERGRQQHWEWTDNPDDELVAGSKASYWYRMGTDLSDMERLDLYRSLREEVLASNW